MNRFADLVREIHARSLWQVLGIYIAGAWGALQGVETIVDAAGLPDWLPGMALVLLIIGLPVVVATAFVQQKPADASLAEGSAVGGAGPTASRSRSSPSRRPAKARKTSPSPSGSTTTS